MTGGSERAGGADDELLHPRDVLAARWAHGKRPGITPPQGVILCYQADWVRSAVPRWRTRRVRGFGADLRLLGRTQGRVAVASAFGVGAPAAVALLEELAAFGVRRFVSLGVAGGLRLDLQVGDLVVAERALRDEGTSDHYLAEGEAAVASAGLTRQLAEALRRAGHAFLLAATATTDAPYRTTRAGVERWMRAGAVAVEMEAAGLFAAARRRGVEVAAACCIADAVSSDGWRLAFNPPHLARGLRALLDAALAALDTRPGGAS